MPLPIYQSKAQNQNQPKVIAIAAGKGGVGKSSVAVNLALALCRLGLKVGVFDADIYGPSVRRMLPEITPPSQRGQVLVPAICASGIRMLSMAYFRKEQEAAVIRAPIANGIVMQFIQNTAWGDLDYLLIDFPPGTGDIQLTLSQKANLAAAVMVTTPQEIALMDVRKAINMFEQLQVPILGVVENMSYYQHAPGHDPVYLFGKGGGQRLAQAAAVPFLGEIPVDPEVCRCADDGRALISNLGEGTSPAVKAFLALARAVHEEMQQLGDRSGQTIENFELQWKEMPVDAAYCHQKH